VRVLHVVAPGEVGGLERVVRLLSEGQAQAGEEVHLAAVVPDRGPWEHLLDAVAAPEVARHPIAVPARGYRRERAALDRLCRSLRPDVVHTHGFRPDVVDGGVPRALGVATVTTVHGFTGGGWRVRLYERLQRRAHRSFDAVAAVSRPLSRRLASAGVEEARLHVIPNAWRASDAPLERAAARRVLGLPEDETVIGWVGRVSVEKGLDVLLDALARLADLPLSVVVLGDGPERGRLARRAERGGLRVFWRGVVSNADRFFPAFDLFVQSSRTEGTPIALFEAMAAALPIVATAVGGVPDVVSAPEALLVPPEDPARLAAAIRSTIERRDLSAARGVAARRRLCAEFDVERWVERYRLMYLAARRSVA